MTKIQSGIKITAPATISGIGCGTDIFAFALDKPADEIIVQKGLVAGISIKSISGDKGKLSTSILENPAGLAAHLVWKALIEEHAIDDKIAVELDIKKKVPFDKGLGDKESLVVAAAIAVNEFFGSLFSKRELLPIIKKACTTLFSEFSLAALTTSLMGGCMMIADKDLLDVRRLPVPHGLFLVIAYPTMEIAPIPFETISNLQSSSKLAIEQSRMLASFFWAMYRSDLELIGRSIQSPLFSSFHEEHFPFLKRTKEEAIKAGALAVDLCNNGPGIFALCTGTIAAEKCSNSMKQSFKEFNLRAKIITSTINNEGAFLA